MLNIEKHRDRLENYDKSLESPYLYRTEAREWKEWLLDD